MLTQKPTDSTLRWLFVTLVLIAALAACERHEEPSTDAQMQWLADTASGMTRQVDVAGRVVRVTFLPSQYLERLTGASDDSARAASGPDSTLSFRVTIAPLNGEADILLTSSRDHEEFSERLSRLNFDMAEYFMLEYGDRTDSPGLVILEGSHGVGGARTLLVVFHRHEPAWTTARSAVLTFDDRVFTTGINHFRFDPKHLTRPHPLSQAR